MLPFHRNAVQLEPDVVRLRACSSERSMKPKSNFRLTHDVHSTFVPMTFRCINLLDQNLVTCDVVSTSANRKGKWHTDKDAGSLFGQAGYLKANG